MPWNGCYVTYDPNGWGSLPRVLVAQREGPMSEQLDQRFASTPMPGGGWAPIGRSSQRGKRLVRIDVDVDKPLARVEFQIGFGEPGDGRPVHFGTAPTGPSSANHWETKNLSPFGSLTNCRTVGSQPA